MEKLDKISENIVELKVAMAKLDANYGKAVEILDRLTVSVEEHIRRTDALEEMIMLEQKKNELAIVKINAELEKKKSNDKMVWTVLVAVGAIILGLNQLGVLQKLF